MTLIKWMFRKTLPIRVKFIKWQARWLLSGWHVHRDPIRKEKKIVCDGCGKEMDEVGQIHECYSSAYGPQKCGEGVKRQHHDTD